MQLKTTQKRASPKACATRHGASPRVTDRCRASWNPGLEKALVDLLHEHNNPADRGQNGWATETWNKMVKTFHERHPYVKFTKAQIQEKEKELKRDYRMLKEARKQSGASWNDQRCMIEAEAALWNNIIISFPRAKKFRNKSFPLFDALGELYDGQTAEGSFNFTSASYTSPLAEPSQYPIFTQVDNVDDSISTEIQFPDIQDTIDHDGEDVGISNELPEDGVEPMQNQERKRVGKEPKETKRLKQNGDVAGMIQKYMDMRRRQVEEEAARLASEREEAKHVEDFSIKRCIHVLNTMEEMASSEKVKAYGVFKNAENRGIFLSADPESALMWLRSEMANKCTSLALEFSVQLDLSLSRSS